MTRIDDYRKRDESKTLLELWRNDEEHRSEIYVHRMGDDYVYLRLRDGWGAEAGIDIPMRYAKQLGQKLVSFASSGWDEDY